MSQPRGWRGMSKISHTAVCIVVLAAPLLSGIGASRAAGDSCAIAPGAAAPKGEHWYYRVDSVNHRHCWYLHAIVRLASRAASDSLAANSESAAAVATPPSSSAATPPTTDPADAPSDIGRTNPAPHVRVLNVKPVTPPEIDPTSASQAVAPEEMEEPPTAIVSVAKDAKPARAARLATVQATDHDSLAPARGEVAASAGSQSARLILPLLALALGIAAALAALLCRISRLRRAPRLSEHPDDAWRRYHAAQADEAVTHQEDAPFLAPGEPYRAVDLDAPAWLDQSSPAKADFPLAPRHGKPWPSERADLTQKDIELRLRILRQPRRGVVPSETEH
jgi:hypothetical protein